MFIKPAAGLKVRDYRTLALVPEAGIEVPDHDAYWVRLVRDGDVVRVNAAPAVPAAPVDAKEPK